jgi:hypothetical protein
MAESIPNDGKEKTAVDGIVERYVKTLTPEHKMLVVLKCRLYGGSWESMLSDLNNRLAGKPYIFKLVNRINDDIERIEQLRQFETMHKVELGDYVELGA